MFKLLSKLSFFVFAVIGGYNTLFDFINHSTQKDFREISWASVDKNIYLPSDIFDISTSFNGVDFEGKGNKIYETIVTFWNTGDTTISDSEARIPLRILAGASAKIVSAKIIQSKSLIDNNFVINLADDRHVDVHWKLFDPDMATKIAILHAGPERTLKVDGNFGTNTAIVKSDSITLRVVLVIIFCFLLLMVITITLFMFLVRITTPDYELPESERSFIHRYSNWFFPLGMVTIGAIYYAIWTYAIPFAVSQSFRKDAPISIDSSITFYR